MKSLITIGFFVGVIFITIGYINQLHKCPPPQIEYRYVPRTFDEDQDNPVRVSEVFDKMFREPTPWVAGLKLSGKKSNASTLNRYYITQGDPLRE